jgi:hypothetical protein
MGELMGNGTDQDIFELETPSKWTTEAVDFLTATETASALQLSEVSASNRDDGLLLIVQHPFLRNPPQTNELIQLVLFAQLSAYRIHKKINQ